MERLFLLDAYALIYRSYYAFLKNPRINSKGLNTSAIMGFVNTLNEVITKEQPTYMAVAFDHGKTFRHEAFPAYKAQREETPEDIRASVPIIKDILEAYHIPVLQADGFEADDVIGTLATAAGREGIETYMLTPDKDYGQLVGGNVYMYRPRHGGGYDTLGESEVTQKYGISTTAQVIDLLALMGDSADNFPGCPGVGEKTAAKLITQFGSIDNMLAHTDEIKGKLREKVEGAVDDIRMSRFLATIRTDVPIALDLEKMKMTSPDEERLEKIFQELEFRALTDKIIKKVKNTPKKDDLQLDLFGEFAAESQGEPKNASILGLKETPHDYQLIESEEEARKIRDYFLTKEILSFDTETTSTNAIDAELVGLSFAVEEFKAVYVAVPAEREAAQRMVDIFRPLYEDEHIMKVGQNIKYDYEVLRRYGIEVRGPMFDTMLAHYIVQPELHHNMDYMAETLLGYQTIHIDQLIGPRGKGQRSMRDLQPQEVYEYAAEDADVTLRLYLYLKKRLENEKAVALYETLDRPCVKVLFDMERAGVKVCQKELSKLGADFAVKAVEIEKKVFERAGEEFNLNSPMQLGKILFEKLNLPYGVKNKKTGAWGTDASVLEELAENGFPIAADILKYRQFAKLKSTYTDALQSQINPKTGRVHTTFMQTGTSTGRLSSNDPNLQNIPIRQEEGRAIRRAFIAERGKLLMSADYSQIELRLMAHVADVKGLKEAFAHGADIHAATASQIFGVPVEGMDPMVRRRAKAINFGIIYGISAFGLARQLGIDRKEAQDYINAYFARYPEIKTYMEQTVAFARENGFVMTPFGRKCAVGDMNDKNAARRQFAERSAINAPIQGGAADIIKKAMIRLPVALKRAGLNAKPLLQVHDELILELPAAEADATRETVKNVMENVVSLSVPLIAEVGVADNWADAH